MLKKLILLNILLTLVFSVEAISQTSENKLINIDSINSGISPNSLDIKVTEFERNKNISKVKITLTKGTSVSSSMFIVFAHCQLAKHRNYKYFVILEDKEKDPYTELIGLTNKENIDVKKEFGTQYSYSTNSNTKLLSVDGTLCSFVLNQFNPNKTK